MSCLLSSVPCRTREVNESQAIECLERTPQWVWVAMDPESKLLLAIDVGNRTRAMTPLCPPRRPALGPQLCPAVSHGWFSGVSDSLADPLWALGAAAPPPGQGPFPKPRWMPLP